MLSSLAVLFAATDFVVAQSIQILPRGAEDSDWLLPPYQLGIPTVLGDGSIRLYAELEFNGVRIDISEICSWAVTSDGFTTWHSADKALGLSPGTTAVVRVSYGELETTAAIGWLPTEIAYSSDRTVDRDTTIPTQGELGLGVHNVLDALEGLGIPVYAWRRSANNTAFADDRDAIKSHFFGESVPMTGPATAARFFRKGLQIYLAEDNYPTVTYFDLDGIILRPDIAEALANPPADSPIFKVNPNSAHIAEWAKTPLHELLHRILYYNDLEDDFPSTPNPFDDETEDLVTSIENIVFPNLVAILRTIAQPELTDGDRQSLHNRVRELRNEILRLRSEYTSDLVDAILETLGWTDADSDGLPDWLEQKLRDKGINPDQPIWTPAPGGGGNPLPVDEDPLPPDGDNPTVEPDPEVEPIDPNG
jgi:hypothetical protein